MEIKERLKISHQAIEVTADLLDKDLARKVHLTAAKISQLHSSNDTENLEKFKKEFEDLVQQCDKAEKKLSLI